MRVDPQYSSSSALDPADRQSADADESMAAAQASQSTLVLVGTAAAALFLSSLYAVAQVGTTRMMSRTTWGWPSDPSLRTDVDGDCLQFFATVRTFVAQRLPGGRKAFAAAATA